MDRPDRRVTFKLTEEEATELQRLIDNSPLWTSMQQVVRLAVLGFIQNEQPIKMENG